VDVNGPRLEARDLYRFFHAGDDEVLALRGVSLVVEAGELVAVLGPSGSGKSTLLACLAGLDQPDGGMVRVDGVPLSRRPEEETAAIRARSIGVLFQNDNLVGHLTVDQNVEVAQRLAARPDATRRRDMLTVLGLGHRARAYPAQLSGGEAVRAAIAVALANDPALVVADEPTGELDSVSEQSVLRLMRARVTGGAALVVATHSEAVAAAADRVITLSDGRVAA
jgi:putative ABC transport system ATP-binding protein